MGSTPLTGDYQEKNIVTVVEAIEKLGQIITLKRESISRGISSVTRNTGLMGRFQVLQEKPIMICDTGHNGHGLKYVTRQLLKNNKGKLHVVCGFVNDKSLDLVLPLFPAGQNYYFTKASVSRALDENQLAAQAKGYGLTGKVYDCVSAAVEAAISGAGSDDIVFIGGSTFVVADALRFLKGDKL
jgi:dihydrofolate synthase/folylpolyglutamate synthase